MIYYSNVDAHPSWAKRLEAHLTAGAHVVTFRARSPHNDNVDVCRAVFTVKGTVIHTRLIHSLPTNA